MPVPKRKRSKARRDKRFANKGMKIHAIAACQNCQAPLMPHAACKACGMYKGVKVLKTKGERVLTRMTTRQLKRSKSSAGQQAGSEQENMQE